MTNFRKRSIDEFDIISEDFIEDFERLVNNVPRNNKNLERQRKGKVEFTLSAVDDETGRSRSLIARSNTKYY